MTMTIKIQAGKKAATVVLTEHYTASVHTLEPGDEREFHLGDGMSIQANEGKQDAVAVVKPGTDMTRYVGTKAVNAKPMTRAAYNDLRGWELPADEDGSDAGYLVEYADGQRPNVDGFDGYVSWSPADVFERSYRPA